MFAGHYDRELFFEYRKWVPFVGDIFLPIIDSENGDFRSLPFEGGILQQPYMTMQLLRLIQLNYRKYISKKRIK